VSKGAQKILSLLPVQEITPAELLKLRQQTDLPNNVVYKVVFEERHLSAPKEQGRVFDLQEYYQHPELFKGVFEQYLLYLNVLMNCMYWDDRYPRIVTKDFLEIAWEEGTIPIEVIGDVTCDPDGSVEITHIGTAIDDPVFVYNPLKRNVTMGFEGEGVLVMAVNILPSELPRESSQAFSDALIKFLPELLKTDFEVSFDELKMPAPLKKALILHHGNLTPDYQYLINHI
jgi:alpha-aminoadipic semialdehyde synthase